MGDVPTDEQLMSALEGIAQRGAIGERSLPAAVLHADEYAAAVPATARQVADLGSGGGLPGLVVAVRCPWVALVLVERRTTRADMLRRAVRALDLDDQVEVLAEDVRLLAETRPNSFDVVTARSFAGPAVTARWAAALLRPGGLLLVSEPPQDDPQRWPEALLQRLGLEDLGRMHHLRRFRRR